MQRNGNFCDIERCAPDFFMAGMDRLIDDIEHHPRERFPLPAPSSVEVEFLEWKAREQHYGEAI